MPISFQQQDVKLGRHPNQNWREYLPEVLYTVKGHMAFVALNLEMRVLSLKPFASAPDNFQKWASAGLSSLT